MWSIHVLGEHLLFAGSGDGSVRIWDMRRTPAQTAADAATAAGSAWGPAAAASAGAAAAGRGLVACMHAHKAGSCALALDLESRRRMASGGHDRLARLWQLPCG